MLANQPLCTAARPRELRARIQCAPAQLQVAARRLYRVHAAAPQEQTTKELPIRFNHLLLTILDANEYLSEGSKQAVNTAAVLAQKELGKVTVLVINEPGTQASEPDKQIETISWHLRGQGVEQFEVLQRATTQPASVLIGDVADEVEADMVVVSTEAVHAKHVDANQLAEFVACPLLMLP